MNHSESLIQSILSEKITIIYKDPNKISPHLNCPICFQIYTSPTRLYCGHTFCYKCLETLFDGDRVGGSRLTDDRTCPICRMVINRDKIGKDFIAQDIVDEIIVVCPRFQCIWEGMRKDVEDHCKRQCLFKKSQKIKDSPAVKGSFLARLYAKNKELHTNKSFEEFKNRLEDLPQQPVQLSKREARLQKQKSKETEDSNRMLEEKMRELDEIQQLFVQKSPEEYEKKFREEIETKKKQKEQKRLKNLESLQKMLKQQHYQTLEENKRMWKEKRKNLEQERLKQLQIKENFGLKLNVLQKIMGIKKSKDSGNNPDFHELVERQRQLEENYRTLSQSEEKSTKTTPQKQSKQSAKPKMTQGVMQTRKPTLKEYQQKMRSVPFEPFVEPKPSHEPEKIYDRGASSVKFTYDICQAYNPRYAEPKVIVNMSDKPKEKPHMYEATYEKHRLVRRPWVAPKDDGKVPEKIPHRYFSSIQQFSDPEYLVSDKANRKGDYSQLESSKKHIGMTNFRLKNY